MQAVVTIKASPTEFDLIRAALRLYEASSDKEGADLDMPTDIRRAARLRAETLRTLQKKIGG